MVNTEVIVTFRFISGQNKKDKREYIYNGMRGSS